MRIERTFPSRSGKEAIVDRSNLQMASTNDKLHVGLSELREFREPEKRTENAIYEMFPFAENRLIIHGGRTGASSRASDMHAFICPAGR